MVQYPGVCFTFVNGEGTAFESKFKEKAMGKIPGSLFVFLVKATPLPRLYPVRDQRSHAGTL